MDIHRVGRTQLGVCYRSRLGVLTRPNPNIVWRMIVCIEPGYGMVINEAEIRAKYEAIRDDLAEDRDLNLEDVTVEFNDRWLLEMAELLEWESESKHVRNLVFIIGGANPTVFDYFKNYRYFQSDEQMLGGTGERTITTTNRVLSYNDELLPPVGYIGTIVDYQDFIDSCQLVETDPDITVVTGTISVCTNHDDGYFYDTDYTPELGDVLNATWTTDIENFAVEFSARQFRSHRTFFLFDPAEDFRPAEQNLTERDYIWDTLATDNEWNGNEFMRWTLAFTQVVPPGSGEFLGLYYILFGAAKKGDIVLDFEEAFLTNYGQYLKYFCSLLTPEDGSLNQYLHAIYAGIERVSDAVHRTEGVDKTHDSTETTESLLEDIIATYGEEYDWSYVGRVDSLTLTADELTSMLPATAFA